MQHEDWLGVFAAAGVCRDRNQLPSLRPSRSPIAISRSLPLCTAHNEPCWLVLVLLQPPCFVSASATKPLSFPPPVARFLVVCEPSSTPPACIDETVNSLCHHSGSIPALRLAAESNAVEIVTRPPRNNAKGDGTAPANPSQPLAHQYSLRILRDHPFFLTLTTCAHLEGLARHCFPTIPSVCSNPTSPDSFASNSTSIELESRTQTNPSHQPPYTSKSQPQP